MLLRAVIDLAQNRYLDDDEFIAYLEYLQYWTRPPYVQYLVSTELEDRNFSAIMFNPST